LEEKAFNRKDRKENPRRTQSKPIESALLCGLFGFSLRPLRLEAFLASDNFARGFPAHPRLISPGTVPETAASAAFLAVFVGPVH
jgi:hypothetical protein